MVGQKLADQKDVRGEVVPPYFSVKEAVFPFNKFPGVDPILGPEMRSTGEVMGVGPHLRRGDAEEPARRRLAPADARARCCITVKNADKPRAVEVARDLHALGFPLVATRGHGGGDRRGRHPGARGQQGQGRPAAHRRHDQERRDPAGLHDRRRDAHRDRRFAPHPPGRARPPRHVLHDHGRLRSGGRRHEAPRRPRRHLAAGTARGCTDCTKLARQTSAAAGQSPGGGFSFCPRFDHGHDSADPTRCRKTEGRAAPPEDGRAPRRDPGDLGGARPGRPVRERRVRGRQGQAGLHRRPHPRDRKQARGGADHRPGDARRRGPRRVRLDRRSRGRGERAPR